MAIPIKAIPVIKAVTDEIDRRNNNPTMSSSNEYSKVHSIPIRFAINGAAGGTKVKAISGIVVTIPATALLIPVSSRIRLINGPIDVIGAIGRYEQNADHPTDADLCFIVFDS
ncbi:hypothetical protein LAV79_17835 [Peribacillus butanolivorans]